MCVCISKRDREREREERGEGCITRGDDSRDHHVLMCSMSTDREARNHLVPFGNCKLLDSKVIRLYTQ